MLCLVLFSTINFYFGKIGMYSYPFSKIPGHLLFVKGEGMFWAVAAEFKYYFALPVLLVFSYKICKLKPMPFLVILVSINLLAYFGLAAFKLPPFPFVEILPVFSLGCFIAVFEENKKGIILSPGIAKMLEMAALLSIFGLLMFVPLYFNKIFGHEHSLKNREDYFIFALLWGAILSATLFARGIFTKIFEWKLFRFLGTISYSVYLFHLPVLFFVYNCSCIPQELKIYAFLGLSVSLCSLVYLLIERPLTMIKIKYLSGR